MVSCRALLSIVAGSKRKELAAAASANPSSSMVAGARNAECYTAPETYRVPTRTGWKRQPSMRRTRVKPASPMRTAMRSIPMAK